MTIFDDSPRGDKPKQVSVLDPQLAVLYRDAARMAVLEGEEALSKRLRPAKDDPRVGECRAFLQALTKARGDGLPVLFNVVMRASVAAAHAKGGAGSFPKTLFGAKTTFEKDGECGLRGSINRTFALGPGKKGDFPMMPSVMGKLHVLNSLGYDIHVVANGMLFNHRSKAACPGCRILVVELDHASMREQEALLEAIKPTVAAAVFSGKRSIHMLVPLARPIVNPRRVRAGDWKGFMTLRRTGFNPDYRIPELDRAVALLRGIVFGAVGKEPDPKVLGNIACLTRCPGFRHGATGGLSKLLHADPEAKWDNPARCRVVEDESPELMAVWSQIARDWRIRNGLPEANETAAHERSVFPNKFGLSDFDKPATCGGLERTDVEENKASEPEPRHRRKEEEVEEIKGSEPYSTHGKEQEGWCIAKPPNPIQPPVLYKDDTKPVFKAPARTFFEDLDDFESLLSKGIPERHQRSRMHGVAMNAARVLGWIPGEGVEGWPAARLRLLLAWRRIVQGTIAGNIGMSVDEAVEDFARHLDASGKGKLRLFRPRMPDFTSLPGFGDVRAAARILRRRIVTLMEVGVLPKPAGDKERHVASGAARIMVELLWPLARRVPGQCLEGTASIASARMRAMCPGRRNGPEVVRWMSEAGILKVTAASYARWDPRLGRGRTRLYRVNLPLVVWLAGIRKRDVSWTATKASRRPQVAMKTVGKAKHVGEGQGRNGWRGQSHIYSEFSLDFCILLSGPTSGV